MSKITCKGETLKYIQEKSDNIGVPLTKTLDIIIKENERLKARNNELETIHYLEKFK